MPIRRPSFRIESAAPHYRPDLSRNPLAVRHAPRSDLLVFRRSSHHPAASPRLQRLGCLVAPTQQHERLRADPVRAGQLPLLHGRLLRRAPAAGLPANRPSAGPRSRASAACPRSGSTLDAAPRARSRPRPPRRGDRRAAVSPTGPPAPRRQATATRRPSRGMRFTCAPPTAGCGRPTPPAVPSAAPAACECHRLDPDPPRAGRQRGEQIVRGDRREIGLDLGAHDPAEPQGDFRSAGCAWRRCGSGPSSGPPIPPAGRRPGQRTPQRCERPPPAPARSANPAGRPAPGQGSRRP